jgi:hypothetical protein
LWWWWWMVLGWSEGSRIVRNPGISQTKPGEMWVDTWKHMETWHLSKIQWIWFPFFQWILEFNSLFSGAKPIWNAKTFTGTSWHMCFHRPFPSQPDRFSTRRNSWRLAALLGVQWSTHQENCEEKSPSHGYEDAWKQLVRWWAPKMVGKWMFRTLGNLILSVQGGNKFSCPNNTWHLGV